MMKRVLVTGMSGVGKSSVIGRLIELGHGGVDLDDAAWSEWVDCEGEGPSPLYPGKDWVWREGAVRELLAAEGGGLLFLSGCSPNMAKFRERLDAIVLLSAPAEVMVERLTRRDTNHYGKHPEEVARSLEFKQTVEPMLREIADLEIDTRAPLAEVVATILKYATAVGGRPAR